MCVTFSLKPLALQVTVCPKNLWVHHWLQPLIFGKSQKSLWIKGSKMVRWWTAKEKNFWTYFAILKVVRYSYWRILQDVYIWCMIYIYIYMINISYIYVSYIWYIYMIHIYYIYIHDRETLHIYFLKFLLWIKFNAF